MGTSKTNLFSEVDNELALAAKAFAHPARVAIIEHLLKTNKCINGDLVDELGLAQATISQHLQLLREVGIIKGNIEGASVCYCIDESRWIAIQKQFDALFNRFTSAAVRTC